MSERANSMHHPETGQFNSKVNHQGLEIGTLSNAIGSHGAIMGQLGAAKRRVDKAQDAHAAGAYSAAADHLNMAAMHLKAIVSAYPPARELAAKAQERAGIAASMA